MAAKHGKKTYTAKGNKRYAKKKPSYTGRVGKKGSTGEKEQAGKELPAGRFQGRFLAVEWRSSVVLEQETFVNAMECNAMQSHCNCNIHEVWVQWIKTHYIHSALSSLLCRQYSASLQLYSSSRLPLHLYRPSNTVIAAPSIASG